MDWFDQYLNALSDGKNATFPPDTHTWKPAQPTKQQKRFIQDSVVFDLQRMRMIQEARLALEQQSTAGSYDSGSAPRKEGSIEPPVPPDISQFFLTYLTEEIQYEGETLAFGS